MRKMRFQSSVQTGGALIELLQTMRKISPFLTVVLSPTEVKLVCVDFSARNVQIWT